MTSLTMPSPTVDPDLPTTLLGPSTAPGPATAATTGSELLLFGLSLAVVLPPAAWLTPSTGALPTFHPASRPLLDPAELRAILGRPAADVGRGRISLEQVDRRLRGLTLTLNVLRPVNTAEALVTIGVISANGARDRGDAAPSDLWSLARATVPRHAIVRTGWAGGGDNAISVSYGRLTAQIAWMAGSSLATVSVTSLGYADERRAELANAIASLLAARLNSGVCPV